MKFSLKNKGS